MFDKMMDTIGFVEKSDPELGRAMNMELQRQRRHLELIASENFVSPQVMAAMGSAMTNKYAEGLPSRRYYGGCEFVDMIENIAIERAKELFGADHVNVQPHSGAQANAAAYFSLLKPGDKVLGMSLADGGHLTHGSPVNFSGQFYHFISYGVDPNTGRLNYDQMEKCALQEKPKLIVAGASAYPRVIDFERIGEIAKKAGAYFMVDMAHIAGLVSVGLHPSPIPYADIVTTTTHKTLRGPRGGLILCKEAFAKQVDKSVFPGMQGGPLMHVIAAKAVCLKEALRMEFRAYQEQIVSNAKALAEGLKKRGFQLISGGTDNHLLLVDLRNFHITGKELEQKLDQIYITANKNAIPNDPEGPFVTSGIRLGTPAVTTRGLMQEDMDEIAECIYLAATDFENQKEKCRGKVESICKKYPLYED